MGNCRVVLVGQNFLADLNYIRLCNVACILAYTRLVIKA